MRDEDAGVGAETEVFVHVRNTGTQSNLISSLSGGLCRGDYFAALFVLGCVSGLTSRIIEAVNQWGWADAILNTFGVSVIIWISCIVGISLTHDERGYGLVSKDLAVGGVFAALTVLPVGQLSWVAMAGLALYLIVTTEVAATRRGAFILLASTVPLLWSRLLFHFFSRPILEMDALLASWLLGTERTGTLVEFVDHSGELAILPPCSSLANVSLAFLCWVLLSRWVNHKRSAYDAVWCLLACVSVVALNVIRLGIYGLSKWNYLMFHTPWADGVDNLLITVVVFGICALGVRRELFQLI